MNKGLKRGSPGAEDEKNPLHDEVELSVEEAEKLERLRRQTACAELAVEMQAAKIMNPAFEKRREALKAIPKFWPIALMNHQLVAFHAQHSADQSALSYLEDLWVIRDPTEPRVYTLEFYFKENPYFTDKVLKKEYKVDYKGPAPPKDETPDEHGVRESMIDFEWNRDVTRSAQKINWKSDDKNLTKLYPREVDDEDDDDDAAGDPGSFFNFFEHEADPSDMGVAIATDVFAEAIEYFLGHAGNEDDSEDESEDDDDDAEEIDLEKPRAKRPKF